MKPSTGSRGWILMGAGLLLLIGSGTRHANLVNMRKTEHLQEVAPEDTTPLVAITTVAFGGFRGLVADALWVRANKMQEEGQFFELVQLARWITQLEPRVPEVWSFQAWNLAYNISVLFPEFEDRWRWVNHGIDLLRKEGLTHNPNSATLHWDIGWMFQHKIGMEFDTAHWLYKQKLNQQIEELLPDGHLPESDVSAEVGRQLADRFSMRAGDMRELDAEYGPLDWRMPDTHTLYWSTRGLPLARDTHRERMLRRMRMQSLGALMRRGRTLTDPESRAMVFLPRFDLVSPVLEEYQTFLAARPSNQYLQQGYENVLRDAMLLHAEYGQVDEAFGYYPLLAGENADLPEARETFQAFVQQELTREPGELSQDQAMTRVVALIRRSRTEPDPVRARGYLQMARQIHQLYQQSRVDQGHFQRTGLPEFEVMVRLLKSENG
ncbi:MAG: hypothetical protein WD708_03025 [Kiritimatiellia bacterium]